MRTSTLVVGSSVKVAIVPLNPATTRILLYENTGASSQQVIFMAPDASSPQVTRPNGGEIVLTVNPSAVAQVLGYLLAGSGSLTMAQEEYP